MSNDIVIVGSCMIDFISYTPSLPKPGETIHGTGFSRGFGGKGANQCVAAAKVGGKTSLVARLGDDVFGNEYLEQLKKENVSTTFVLQSKGVHSGIAQISVDESGENQIVIVAGANNDLREEDVKRASDLLSKAKVVVMQLEAPSIASRTAMQLTKGITILNGAPADPNMDCTMYKMPTIFCINETEASIFTGLPVNNLDQAKDAIKALLKKGCQSVLLTLGPDGTMYASQENTEPAHIACKPVAAVDTTGAGDAFIGALAYMLAEYNSLPIEKSILVACHLAAYSVQYRGTQSSYPDKNELEKVLQELNIMK